MLGLDQVIVSCPYGCEITTTFPVLNGKTDYETACVVICYECKQEYVLDIKTTIKHEVATRKIYHD